jgi:hypothetical protein
MAALLPILQLTRKLATILGLHAYTFFFVKMLNKTNSVL